MCDSAVQVARADQDVLLGYRIVETTVSIDGLVPVDVGAMKGSDMNGYGKGKDGKSFGKVCAKNEYGKSNEYGKGHGPKSEIDLWRPNANFESSLFGMNSGRSCS